MAPRSTRSKPAPAPPAESESVGVQPLVPEHSPHRMYILPRDTCDAARILSLPNPSTSALNRYLFCPKTGLYEFTAIAPSRATPQSWLLVQEQTEPSEAKLDELLEQRDPQQNAPDNGSSFMGHTGIVQQKPNLFVATPFDPLFLVIPLLETGGPEKGRVLFRMEDDYLDLLEKKSKRIPGLLRHELFKKSILARLETISDVQEAGDEKTYRLNADYVLNELIEKATAIARQQVWPKSMDALLIHKELQMPHVPNTQEPVEGSSTLEMVDTNAASSAIPDETEGEPPTETKYAPHGVSEELITLARFRKALDFILRSYVQPEQRSYLEEKLAASKRISFVPLEKHLGQVEKAKEEARALRSLSDNISRKRSAYEDEEAAEARAEKKRRKEEEDKRKKNESRGVKELKKVDTSGMKKLSSFFKKPA